MSGFSTTAASASKKMDSGYMFLQTDGASPRSNSHLGDHYSRHDHIDF